MRVVCGLFCRSALRIAANLVVISWAYLLSIHSCLLDFLLTEILESWVCNKLTSGLLEAIAIGLRIEREKNSNKVQVCLINTSEVTGMQKCFRLAILSIYIWKF